VDFFQAIKLIYGYALKIGARAKPQKRLAMARFGELCCRICKKLTRKK
jgi:hypothetical protein